MLRANTVPKTNDKSIEEEGSDDNASDNDMYQDLMQLQRASTQGKYPNKPAAGSADPQKSTAEDANDMLYKAIMQVRIEC